jgi:glycosyltransferase involved in cell wall biosynthesis
MNNAVTLPKQKTELPIDVPRAPADLWRRKFEPFSLVIARFIGLLVIVSAPIFGYVVLSLLSVIVFVLQVLTNFIRHGMFRRNIDGLPSLTPGVPPVPYLNDWPGISLISPARNEEEGIEEAARSVAALDYPDLEAIYVNDHSTDSTRAILDRLASEFPRISVVHDPPTQEGWLGKANAVWQGLRESDASKPWILLTDADVVLHPDALRQAISLAEANKLDFLTCISYIDNKSFAEELFMPQAWAGIVQGAHFDRLNEARTPSIGVGAFTMVKRETYIASGGHAAIRDRQPEDTLLAALIKKHGGNMGVCWTSSMVRVRIYRGFAQLQQFMVRKIRMQNEDGIPRILNRIVYILIQDVLPLPLFVAAVARQIWLGDFSFTMSIYAAFALLAYITCVASHDKFRNIAYMRPRLEWLHPLGGLLRIYLYIRATLQILGRKGMEWRGRDYSHS